MPAAAAGAREPLERARIRISVSVPSPDEAKRLRETFPPIVATGDGGPGERPPLLERMPRPVPVGHLSYSALADYERCGYRFYVERVLGLREAALDAGDDAAAADPEREPDELVEPGSEEASPRRRAESLALGNAVHRALEWSARRRWESPSEEMLRGFLAREGIEPRSRILDRARSLVSGWLDSPLREELGTRGVRPEVPFALPLAGTIIRGKIDLLANGDQPPTVIDFKTDALDGSTPAELGARYRAQRAVYALATVSGTDGPVRTVHCFLEAPTEPVVEEFDGRALAASRASLEALIHSIRSGRFEVTEEPYTALCFGCPAAAHLCPRAAWRPPGTRTS
jgi:ATP-dependent helicase/nuclease subunit A